MSARTLLKVDAGGRRDTSLSRDPSARLAGGPLAAGEVSRIVERDLLDGKKAYPVVTSGRAEVDSPIDFATQYLRHVLGFIGIHGITVTPADRTMMGGDEAPATARARIDEPVTSARAA